MVNDKPVRVAVYARVSTEHEAQVLALDNQLEWYTDIIEKNPNYIEGNDLACLAKIDKKMLKKKVREFLFHESAV